MSDFIPPEVAESIRQSKRDFVARHADRPCFCHRLPDDIPDDIICASCAARRMDDDG